MKGTVGIKRIMLGMAFTAGMSIAPLAYGSSASHGGENGTAQPKSANEVMLAVIGGNDQFKSHHDHHFFDNFQTGQAPNLTVITCSDSRVHTPLFGIDPHNNIFVIRNIGNQIPNSEGSVDYGVNHLPTAVLMVVGHTGCGAIKAAMGDYSQETAGIKKEVVSLMEPLSADNGEGDLNTRWAQNIERNVDYQVGYAKKLYADKISAGSLTVVGGVYDFNDLYGHGRGSLIITNIDGKTDLGKISKDPVLKDLAGAAIANHVGSLAPAPSFLRGGQ